VECAGSEISPLHKLRKRRHFDIGYRKGPPPQKKGKKINERGKIVGEGDAIRLNCGVFLVLHHKRARIAGVHNIGQDEREYQHWR
jgi:hypothetical protein